MKVYCTTALATDVLDDIRDALARAEAGNKPSFKDELQTALVKETVEHLRSGHMDSFSFERLTTGLLIQMGARTATVVPRLLDKGADILATFRVAETFQYTLTVQAKHWNDKASPNTEIAPFICEIAPEIRPRPHRKNKPSLLTHIPHHLTLLRWNRDAHHKARCPRVLLVSRRWICQVLLQAGEQDLDWMLLGSRGQNLTRHLDAWI